MNHKNRITEYDIQRVESLVRDNGFSSLFGKKLIRVLDKIRSEDQYRLFNNVEEVRHMAKEQYGSWTQRLTSEEHKAIQYYAGNTYQQLNSYLRGDYLKCYIDLEEYYELQSNLIDTALEKTSTFENTVAFRWVNSNSKVIKNSIKRRLLIDEAYTSTSLLYDMVPAHIQDEKSLLIIKVRQGTKGALIADISDLNAECEFLIGRGQSYKITKVTSLYHNNFLILCETNTR